MYINQSYFSGTVFRKDNAVHILTKELEKNTLWFNYYREKKNFLTIDNKVLNKFEINKLDQLLQKIHNEITSTRHLISEIKNKKNKN